MNCPVRLAAICAGTLLPLLTCAQFGFGAKGGVNYIIASQTIEPAPKTDPSTPSGLGFQFGGFGQLTLSDRIALRPELIFSFRKAVSDQSNSEQVTYQDQQGNQGTGTQTITQKTDTRLSYFQIPVALCFTPNENFRVMLGPSFNFLMSAKTTADVTQNDKVTIAGQNYDETSFQSTVTEGSAASKYYSSTEIMAMAGAGYKLDMGLDFDLRFYRAIVSTYDQTLPNSRVRAWANMIEFSLGYQF